ncbi:MAG: hypothetical protein ABIN18_09435 [Pseudomonadota bacterium]
MKDILSDIKSMLSKNLYKNEEHVRLSLVTRLMQALGWNVWDPVEFNSEFGPVPTEDQTKVDLALFLTPYIPTIFIEIKAVGRLDGNINNIERQMRDYNRNNTALFSIITDGRKWRFYFSQTGGEFSQKCFKTLDILEDSIDELERIFRIFLSKDEIQSGDAENGAKKYLELNQKQRFLEDALPKARSLILEPPYPSLPQSLTDIVLKSGLSVTLEEAAAFIQSSDATRYPIEFPKVEMPTDRQDSNIKVKLSPRPYQGSQTPSKKGSFEFPFRVNKSFLDNGYLTIPREFNEYLSGSVNLKDKCDIILTSLNNRQIAAYLYHGKSGWGLYYQIRIANKPDFIHTGGLSSHKIDDFIKVRFHGFRNNEPNFSFATAN